MSRRGRRDRPPRLDDLPGPGPRPGPGANGHTRRERAPGNPLVEAGVTGAGRRGSEEVLQGVRRLTAGDPQARFGLDLERVGREEALEGLREHWGFEPGPPRALIDPERTVGAARALTARLEALGAAGGRLGLATARPAALLPLLQRIGARAAAAGATVLDLGQYGPLEPVRHPAHWLWWHTGVAVVSDGERLLADDGVAPADEWLFAVGRPDLVVADHAFAGAAAAAGIETFALAGLDVPAFGVAVLRGAPLRILPLHDGCPPAAYAPLVDPIPATPSAPSGDQGPHSTTGADGT